MSSATEVGLRLRLIRPTYSEKIRALDAAGYMHADIAKFLGKRYQHVRNVSGARPAEI